MDERWLFECDRCRLRVGHEHRHDRDRQRAEHAAEHPTHTVMVGRIIPGQPRKAKP